MLLQVGILDVGASGFPLLNLGLINKWYGHGQEEQKLKENFSNGQEVLDFSRQRKKKEKKLQDFVGDQDHCQCYYNIKGHFGWKDEVCV